MLHQVCFVGGKTSAPSFSNSDLTILELLIDEFFVATLKVFQMQILNLQHIFKDIMLI